MKKKMLITWLIMALCCLLAAFPVMATQSGLTDAKKKKNALKEEIAKAEQQVQKLEGLRGDAVAYVKELDASLATITDELEKLGDAVAEKEKRIAVTREELAEAEQTEVDQYEDMKLRIKYMYEKGDSSYVDLLMQADSLSALLNRAEYIGKISEYDRRKLDEYILIKEEIQTKKQILEQEHEELLLLQEQTEVKHASVEELLAAKERELKNVEKKLEEAEDQVSRYEEDLKAQENAIKAIEAELKRKEEEARKRAEAAGKSYKTQNIGNIKFIWPCPASSRITSRFGSRTSPTEGASSNHQGIDVGAPTGTDIVAAAGGEVVVSTYSYSAGNYVMISHGGGIYTVYMHASKLLVSSGQTVKQGQVIAKVGSTGYSTGPHLHFGIRVNGKYVNPSQYVSP